jgi:hypothetical protein
MQLQNLGSMGFGYRPWGTGTPPLLDSADGGTASAAGADAGTASAPSVASTTATTAADVRESETLNIQLADGTRVTLSMRAESAAVSASQTQADGSSSSAAALFSSGQLQVAVSGTLSDADKQAISAVVSQVDSLATQFFAGDVQDAFAAAASLNIDPTTIASFSLKLTYSSVVAQNTTSTPGSPQQTISNFVQQTLAKLGRGSGNSHSHHDVAASRWKMHLLAQALPAYAQAQAAKAANAANAANAAAAPDPTTPAATSTLQGARLAADSLRQLAQ